MGVSERRGDPQPGAERNRPLGQGGRQAEVAARQPGPNRDFEPGGQTLFSPTVSMAIRRGVFHSVPDLIAAIETYLANYNQDATPFTWTASLDDILEK